MDPPLHLYTDEVSSVGADTEVVSIPPPPPPLEDRIPSMIPFRKSRSVPLSLPRRGGGSAPLPESLPREAMIIEEQDSFEAQDISYWPAVWDSYFQSNGNYNLRKRKICVAMASILVFCMILGLAIGVSNSNQDDRNASLAAAKGQQQIVYVPVPAPAPAPAGSLPGCQDELSANEVCFEEYTIMFVTFQNCNPLVNDWVGIFDVTSSEVSLFDLGEPVMWLWTCNSQELDEACEPTYFDSLPFGPGLPAGTYQAHLVRRNPGGPYSSYAASDEWEVAEQC